MKEIETSPEFPRKLAPMLRRARYKILYGGRGGAKSWNIARWLLIEGRTRSIRVLCAREIQNSIEESVHKLLEQQIEKLGLEYFYEVQQNRIVGLNGTEFVFCGLRHNVRKIKSYEDVDYCWVEEAACVSKDSWDVLIPTIRKSGSEIIVSFNPELDSDETWRRFVVNPPPGAVVIFLSWRDNPWFPEELEAERLHLLETDPEGYENIWEGKTRSALQGAIFAGEIALADKEGRIGNVPRIPMRPVDTYWDLGFGDATAIWFGQSMPDGSIRLIDYLESSGHTIEWYLIQLQQRGYLYGIDWLPHDGVDAIIHQRLVAVPNVSIEMMLRRAGRKPRLAPKLHVTTRINAGRTLFTCCWFDRNKCANGLQSLRHYRWAPPTAKVAAPDPRPGQPAGIAGQVPLHDWASHGADAYQTLAVVAKAPVKKVAPPPPPPRSGSDRSWMA